MGAAVASESFWCKRFKCTLAERACVARQEADPLEGLKGHVVDDRLEYCRSGDCRQGNGIASKLTKLGALAAVEPSPSVAKAIAKDVEEASRESFETFHARKEREREEAETAEPKPEPEPHPLSNRGIQAQLDERGVPCARAGAGCPEEVDPKRNKSGLCRWCSRGIRIGSESHGVLYNSQRRNVAQKIRRAAKGPGMANAPAAAARTVREPKDSAITWELRRMEIILREVVELSPEGRAYVAAAIARAGE